MKEAVVYRVLIYSHKHARRATSSPANSLSFIHTGLCLPPAMDYSLHTTDANSKAISVPSVQELVLKDPHALPDRYIASPEERPSLLNTTAEYGIPVIDMSALLNSESDEARQSEMRNLAMACEDWGFFQLVNHGIPKSLMDRMRRVVREFFQLPPKEKDEYAQQPSNPLKTDLNSNQGYGQAFVVSEDQRLDWSDILFLITSPAEDTSMRFWPTKPADFRETLADYSKETEKLGDKLLNLLAENLGLKPQDYFISTFGKWSESIRMNYYPPCPRPDLVLGLSPHSDVVGMTMLLPDDCTEGLQIHRGGEWIGVQVIADALVINIGDFVEVISNGKYKSIEHRAVANKEKDRTSIAAFIFPGTAPDTEIGPAPDLVDDLHPSLYRKIRRDEYMAYFLGNKLDGKKAMDFVKIAPV